MDEKSFLAEIDADPTPAPKLIFADWLEERGDKRANYLRAIEDQVIIINLLKVAEIEHRDVYWETIYYSEINCFSLFAADCAERVLHLFEEYVPKDKRPRKAIEAARTRKAAAAAAAAAYTAARLITRTSTAAAGAAAAARAAGRSASAVAGGSLSVQYSAAHAAHAAIMASAGLSVMSIKERRWQVIRLCDYKLFQRPVH